MLMLHLRGLTRGWVTKLKRVFGSFGLNFSFVASRYLIPIRGIKYRLITKPIV
jgi:hypothetical protein